MSGVVPVWVPIGVGLLGFAGVLVSQWIGSWREDRRWLRDRERHEDDRRYSARQEAYAQLIGAIERWDLALYPLREARLDDVVDLDPGQVQWAKESVEAADRALGLVVLVAPERTRAWIKDAVLPRHRLTDKLLGGRHDPKKLKREWKLCQDNYRTARALMRHDLGFDAELEYLARAVDLPRSVGSDS